MQYFTAVHINLCLNHKDSERLYFIGMLTLCEIWSDLREINTMNLLVR